MFVYFLKSLKNNDIYVGSAFDVSGRLRLHNASRVKSTKSGVPWKLLDFIFCETRSEAVRKERFFKTGQQKEILREKYVKAW
jgi:putative endonuclease